MTRESRDRNRPDDLSNQVFPQVTACDNPRPHMVPEAVCAGSNLAGAACRLAAKTAAYLGKLVGAPVVEASQVPRILAVQHCPRETCERELPPGAQWIHRAVAAASTAEQQAVRPV
jgi:hypothetical protein